MTDIDRVSVSIIVTYILANFLYYYHAHKTDKARVCRRAAGGVVGSSYYRNPIAVPVLVPGEVL